VKGCFSWARLGLLSALAVSMVVAGCASSNEISRAAALTQLEREIESGPIWATSVDIAAVKANAGYGPPLRAGCSDENSVSHEKLNDFVCTLHYQSAGGRIYGMFFHESLDGSSIVPFASLLQRGSRIQLFRDNPKSPASVPVALSHLTDLFGLPSAIGGHHGLFSRGRTIAGALGPRRHP
jgi:hypothetical protein